MDYQVELQNLKRKAEEARERKAKAESNLENAEEREREILDDIRALGIEDPERLDEEIAAIEKRIEENINEARRLLGEAKELAV